MAEEAAEYYELQELPQEILLRYASERDRKVGGLARTRASFFEVSTRGASFEHLRVVGLAGDWIFEARFCPKAKARESTRAGRQEEDSEVEPEDESSAYERAIPS